MVFVLLGSTNRVRSNRTFTVFWTFLRLIFSESTFFAEYKMAVICFFTGENSFDLIRFCYKFINALLDANENFFFPFTKRIFCQFVIED